MALGFKEVAACVVLSLPLAACTGDEATILQKCQEVRYRTEEAIGNMLEGKGWIHFAPIEDGVKAEKECLTEHDLE